MPPDSLTALRATKKFEQKLGKKETAHRHRFSIGTF
jgi:hypothetical protein